MHKYLFDSHCHLNYDGLHENLDKIISNANAAGVQIMQTICTKMDEVKTLQVISQRFKNIFYSVGVHPCNVNLQKIVTPQELIQLATNDQKITGFGETGLDYYRESSSIAITLQKQSFINHIIAAQETSLPIIIHTRDAEDDTYDVLQHEIQKQCFTGVLHCFTGSINLAMKALDLGLYISASGIITFKNAELIRDVFKILPIERILIETDAPFLAPMPYRGHVNEPAYVIEVAKKLAEIKNLSYEDVVNITTQNSLNLFKRVTLV